MSGLLPKSGTRALMVTGQWLEGVCPSYQLILSSPSRVKVQLKGPEDSAMSLQLAAVRERSFTPNNVEKLIAPKNRDTSPSELVKLISSKINPGKIEMSLEAGAGIYFLLPSTSPSHPNQEGIPFYLGLAASSSFSLKRNPGTLNLQVFMPKNGQDHA